MPDITAISKTKLNSKCNSFVEGYDFFQQNSDTNACGVGTFIKNYLSYSVIEDYDLQIPSCEELWVNVSIIGYDKVFG